MAESAPAGRRRRLAWMLLGAALAALPWCLERAATPPAALALTNAAFGSTVDDEHARPVTLPHRWHPDCGGCRTAWYRIDIDRAALPRETQALLIDAVGHNAAAYLNGRLLGQGGGFADPVARLGDRPLLLGAPVAWWNAGTNRLYVLVKADVPQRGFLARLYLGDEARLQASHGARLWLRVTARQVLATAAVMLGAVMAVLWFYRRREPAYLWLALSCVAWALHQFVALAVQPPWPYPAWDALLAAAAILAATATLGLARAFAGAQRLPRPALAATLVLVPSAAAAAAALDVAGRGAAVATPVALSLTLAAGAMLLHAGWRSAAPAPRWLVPGTALLLLAGTGLAADVAGAAPGTPSALPFAAPLLFATAGWVLLVRFVETLNALELLNIDLEALVRERTAELKTQFERVRTLERGQVIAAERERLMRDMHDGVGGSLVSLLAMIEAGRSSGAELSAAVRGSLDDMRLMIDSLDPVDDDLNAVLAMLHDRLAPRLRAAGIELQWEVAMLPPVPGLTPARVLHVLRLLQEAVTNAIRHGGARRIVLDARAAPDASGGATIRIELRDDGRGFDAGAARGGRGLNNMRRRAAEVGATLQVLGSPGAGTTVRLSIPVPDAPPLTAG